VRHLELSTRATGGVPELRISPGLALTLIFDTPVRQGGVELEERGRFQVVSLDQEGRVLTLVLAPGEAPERPLRLGVHFADGGVPASAAFQLVAHPAWAETHVQVYRQPRSAEVCCQQADAEREKARQCQVELERTRAECAGPGPGGLICLRSQGLLDRGGVPFKKIKDHELTRDKANAFKATDVTTLRTAAPAQKPKEARAGVAVLLRLDSPEARDWKVEGAQLASQGRVWRTVTVWQSAPLDPGSWDVMVEAELTAEEARGRFTLKLWDASASRTVTLGGVTFP
jgi:uncharacterized protein (TIGR02268 family)